MRLTPLILKNGIFLSSCYEVGAGYWNVLSVKSGIKIMNLWRKKGVLDCHYSTPVQKGIFSLVFMVGKREDLSSGVSGYLMERLCGQLRNGYGLVRIADRILCLTEKGELLLFKAQSSGFEIELCQQILGAGDHILLIRMEKLLPGIRGGLSV